MNSTSLAVLTSGLALLSFSKNRRAQTTPNSNAVESKAIFMLFLYSLLFAFPSFIFPLPFWQSAQRLLRIHLLHNVESG